MANLINYTDVLKFLEINMSKNAEKSDGTSTTATTKKLIDSAADFVTDEIKENMIVTNRTLTTFSYITAVDDLNTLSLNDDIFTSTSQEYFIFDYEDMTVTLMEYHINFAIQETFNRLRKKFNNPETLLIDDVTTKEIAIYLAVFKIGTVLYSFFETPLDKLKELRELALAMATDVINGEIVLNVADDSENSGIITDVLNGGDVLRTNDFDDEETQKDLWQPEIDINC